MSSHHVVRDKQEPALIIANGAACNDDLLGQLLEWNPFIVVLDRAIYRVMEKGIKVDVLLGDFDQGIDIEKIRKEQYPIEIVYTPDQDKTDLEKGIEYLVEQGHHAANIIWATGLRADHTLNNLSSMAKYKETINLVMHDNWSKIFCLKSSFEKWYPANTNISIMPISKAGGVKTSGLKYNLDNEDLELGRRTSSSNQTIEDGFIRITHNAGDLFLMQCHD
jgi:thiamine pyrophosphokinase